MNQEEWKLAWSVYIEAAEFSGSALDAFLRSRNLTEEVEMEVRQLLSDRNSEAEDPFGSYPA